MRPYASNAAVRAAHEDDLSYCVWRSPSPSTAHPPGCWSAGPCTADPVPESTPGSSVACETTDPTRRTEGPEPAGPAPYGFVLGITLIDQIHRMGDHPD